MAAGSLRIRQLGHSRTGFQPVSRASSPSFFDGQDARTDRLEACRTLAVSILAGGRSSRMGHDKSRLRVGRRTMLAHAKEAAKALGLPVRVIRRDIVPRCGPLGGVLTALKTSRTEAELFLACDMPFVSVALLRKLLRALSRSRTAAFTFIDRLAGFPFVMRAECAPVVEAQIAAKEFSLQALARALRGAMVSPPRSGGAETFNVNTASDLASARNALKKGARTAMSAMSACSMAPVTLRADKAVRAPVSTRAVNSRRDTRPTAGRPRRPRSRRGQ